MCSNEWLRIHYMVGTKHYQRDRMGSGALQHSKVDIIHNTYRMVHKKLGRAGRIHT